ncbi:MAG: hypothetical protein HQL23_08445 [Candidatus Omnitrophica bacterium]|nr:hypothetical protein [Candidatus Omnitrophota bacterium]
MKIMKMEQGQSTVEYIILVAAVLAALLFFLKPGSGPFSTAFNSVLADSTNQMNVMSGRLRDSH